MQGIKTFQNFLNDIPLENTIATHYVKNVRIRSYSGPYIPHSDWTRSIPYSVRRRENTIQNNSEYGHFSRSDTASSIANLGESNTP